MLNVSSRSTRNVPNVFQPVPYVLLVASGIVRKHSTGFVDVPQPYMRTFALLFSARQPCVFIAVTCVCTAGVIDCAHVVGPVSGAMYVVSRGRPRANHSATMSSSCCVSRGWLPFGIDTRFLNLPYSSAHVSALLLPSPSGNAALNTAWKKPRCAAAE